MTTPNPEKTARQRKIYAAILALALGGLAVDRLFLGGATGPQDASAQIDAAAADPNAPAAPIARASTGPNLTTRSNTLAGRLDRMAQEQSFELLTIDDAFRPALSWVKPSENGTKPIVQLTEAQTFARNHKLMAVINNGGGGAAIIDNQTLTVGKQIDGYTLITVTQRSAVLERFGQRVELTLPDRSKQKTGD